MDEIGNQSTQERKRILAYSSASAPNTSIPVVRMMDETENTQAEEKTNSSSFLVVRGIHRSHGRLLPVRGLLALGEVHQPIRPLADLAHELILLQPLRARALLAGPICHHSSPPTPLNNVQIPNPLPFPPTRIPKP